MTMPEQWQQHAEEKAAEQTEPELIRQEEFIRIAGISYRQFDYWSRTGYLKPEVPAIGQGSRRLFTRREAVRAALMAELIRDVGMAPAKAAETSTALLEAGEVKCGRFHIRIEYMGEEAGDG